MLSQKGDEAPDLVHPGCTVGRQTDVPTRALCEAFTDRPSQPEKAAADSRKLKDSINDPSIEEALECWRRAAEGQACPSRPVVTRLRSQGWFSLLSGKSVGVADLAF